MLLDDMFNFSDAQSLSGTDAQDSTNVYDAGSAKTLFAGAGGHGPKLAATVTAAGGTNPTIQCQFVGADDADLSSNVVVIADSGVSKVLAAADLPWQIEMVPNNQRDAKRYYGLIWDQTGTNPTATVNGQLCWTAQNNLIR